jgi:hypothetical protein
MRIAALLIAVLFLLPSAPEAQSQAPAGDGSAKRSTPITLTGCVSPKPTSGKFTFTAKNGERFRLNGKNLKKYAGEEVEIIGGEGKKLSVKGGLQPSPNAAAQAGEIDPGQAVIASLPGGAATGTGGTLPDFTVSRLRVLRDSCQ